MPMTPDSEFPDEDLEPKMRLPSRSEMKADIVDYIRERPVEATLIAFLSGLAFSRFIR
ncbi:MAG: hypothetical protein JOZ55_12470 [Alphaproteobacteria bacterium]|nr:hypothetical protein [Alphaproteobacteria bacterium]